MIDIDGQRWYRLISNIDFYRLTTPGRHKRKQVYKRVLITSFCSCPKLFFPLRKVNVLTKITLLFTLMRWPVILIRRPEGKHKGINFQFASHGFLQLYASCHTRRPLLVLLWGCESIHFWIEKGILLFHQKTVFCWMLIFFHAKMK